MTPNIIRIILAIITILALVDGYILVIVQYIDNASMFRLGLPKMYDSLIDSLRKICLLCLVQYFLKLPLNILFKLFHEVLNFY